MTKINLMKAVYSYFFPEVRPLVHFGEKLPEELFLTSTSIEEADEILSRLFKNEFKAPSIDGKIDLDMIHVPVIENIVKSYSSIVPNLKDFKFSYPMAGSSQGIFHLLSLLKSNGIDTIYTLEGEYEGYKEYGKTINMQNIEINSNTKNIKPGVWFISNPSARAGNIISNNFINNLCDNGHKVILDLAYLGLTKDYKFDLSHENIIATTISFSKPYGVFRFRIGGFTFSRTPIDSLYANKWFKDVPRLLTSLKIVEEIPLGTLYTKYRPIQEEIISRINRELSLEMKASDVILLGNISSENAKKMEDKTLEEISLFKRGNVYRFCLTPYFEQMEMEDKKWKQELKPERTPALI